MQEFYTAIQNATGSAKLLAWYVLADYLDDQGDNRGEFIRCSIERRQITMALGGESAYKRPVSDNASLMKIWDKLRARQMEIRSSWVHCDTQEDYDEWLNFMEGSEMYGVDIWEALQCEQEGG